MAGLLQTSRMIRAMSHGWSLLCSYDLNITSPAVFRWNLILESTILRQRSLRGRKVWRSMKSMKKYGFVLKHHLDLRWKARGPGHWHWVGCCKIYLSWYPSQILSLLLLHVFVSSKQTQKLLHRRRIWSEATKTLFKVRMLDLSQPQQWVPLTWMVRNVGGCHKKKNKRRGRPSFISAISQRWPFLSSL